jgi:hypothetical protein
MLMLHLAELCTFVQQQWWQLLVILHQIRPQVRQQQLRQEL